MAKGFPLSRGLQLTKKDCKRPFRVCVSVYSQKDFVRQGLLHLAFDLFGGIGRVSNGSIIAAQWRRSSLISFFFIFYIYQVEIGNVSVVHKHESAKLPWMAYKYCNP